MLYAEVAVINKNKKGSEAVRALKSIFAGHEIQEKICSDNVPFFDSGEYAKFANSWGFKITTSNPNFPDPMKKLSMLYRLQSQF